MKNKNIKGGLEIATKKDYLIVQDIKNLFNSELKKNLNIYKLNEDESKLLLYKLNQPVPFSCRELKSCIEVCSDNPPTYMEIFKMIEKIGVRNRRIMLFGGSVRDYLFTNFSNIEVLNDIDINFKTSYERIVDFLQNSSNKREHCFRTYKNESKKYILFGNQNHSEYLEGFQIPERAYNPYVLESRCNSLGIIIDNSEIVSKFYLIDFFSGKGIEDTKNKIYCAPFIDENLTNEKLFRWVSDPKKRNIFWRMLKFANRGYTIDEKTASSIYKYWWSDALKKRENNGVALRWDKIWEMLPAENANRIFGKGGVVNRQLDEIKSNPSEDLENIPTYDELLEYLLFLKILLIDSNGNIHAPPLLSIVKTQSRIRGIQSRKRISLIGKKSRSKSRSTSKSRSLSK
uniref:Poly A polymerase head domain-containing protein n=1 Tax=viral metagenome TaxID=1070528 RepID=A0A6C0HYP4_9ZZZZ